MTIDFCLTYKTLFKARLKRALQDTKNEYYQQERNLIKQSIERLEVLYGRDSLCQAFGCNVYQFNSWASGSQLPHYRIRALISALIRGKAIIDGGIVI